MWETYEKQRPYNQFNVQDLTLVFTNNKSASVFIYFYFSKHLYGSIIALQWCVTFCFITKWISYTYISPHISSLLHLPPTLPIPPLQVVTEHWADLPVLCGCFPLAICFTFGSVYMSMPLSHFVSAIPSPAVSSSLFSKSTSLFLPCHQVCQYQFFRFHTCALAYGICFSPSELLHFV